MAKIRFKKLLFSIIINILMIAAFSQVQAQVTGLCSNCHTMHNSQGASQMADYGGSSGPNPALTRGDCIGCHAYDITGSKIVTIGSSKIPQVWQNDSSDLAGGNFKYIAGATDNVGHNVNAIDPEDSADLFPPPGDHNTTGITQTGDTALACAGAYGCHGDRSVSDQLNSLKGAHHADDSTITGSSTGNSYRFLKGVLGLENNGDHPWQNYSTTEHNEYKGTTSPDADVSLTSPGTNGTISGLCAECHGYYHGDATDHTGSSSPWLRHPTDLSMPGSGTEYADYTTYSIVAPVARVTIPGTPSATVTPTGSDDDIVMCLSCHGAHATENYKLMRWDNKANMTGCVVCHTSKN